MKKAVDEMELVKTFGIVAKNWSIQKAAEEMGLDYTEILKRIKSFETLQKVRYFTGYDGLIELTSEGKNFYKLWISCTLPTNPA
jgi:molybdenum-dependent DNA-binding transcriptional regulator ModE